MNTIQKPSIVKEEFIQLIQNHQGILHKVCSTYIENREERKDLYQEIIIQLWKSYPKFRGESKISTWMYRVAFNTVVSHLRKQKRQPLKSSIDVGILQIADSQLDYEQEEKLKILRAAMSQLNTMEKALLMLYLEDQPYKDIALTLGISPGNARVKITRIKEKLKKIINPVKS